MVLARVVHQPCGLRGEVEQRLDGARRRLPGAQFEDLAEQDENGDDGGRLEVDRDRAAVAAEGRRENSRQHRGHQAVDVGDAGTHGDKGEHVQIAGDERLPAAHEERPSGPQDNGRREGELDPVRQGRIDQTVTADEMATHLQNDRRGCQRKSDPEPPRHVGELGVRGIVERHHLGLKRHAADRAATRPDLPDLRMHRTGVYRSRGHGGLRCSLPGRVEVALRIGRELGAAARRAEMMRLAGECEPVRGRSGIDGHAADGIDGAGGGVGMIPTGMMAVIGVPGPAAAGSGARRSRFRQKGFGRGGELGSAALRAEVVPLAVVFEGVLGCGRIDRHAAYRIDRFASTGLIRIAASMCLGGVMRSAAAAGCRLGRLLLGATTAIARTLLLRIRHAILQQDQNPYPVGVYETVGRRNQGGPEQIPKTADKPRTQRMSLPHTGCEDSVGGRGSEERRPAQAVNLPLATLTQ